jgi:hypothetical protein
MGTLRRMRRRQCRWYRLGERHSENTKIERDVSNQVHGTAVYMSRVECIALIFTC